jgi:transposase
MSLPRFLKVCFEGYEIEDFKEWLKEGRIEIFLERKEEKPFCCHRCGEGLGAHRGKYRVKLEGLPILGFRFFIHFWRLTGECRSCKKARAEKVDFISAETPHLTQDYAWWIGRVCEISAVSRVAELVNQDETTTWRLDLHRMQRMLSHYKIPAVTAISVDEVYARKKPKFQGENRDERFFTVICDLKTRRVIWVTESRKKQALDEFFKLIGSDACQKIRVVAIDQHEGYAASVRENCKEAKIVWDRFHLMQRFEEAVNEVRKLLHEKWGKNGIAQLTMGRYRFLFLKKAHRRTEAEKAHFDEVCKHNQEFLKLELIKERMMSFFEAQDPVEAKNIFKELGDWIWQAQFQPLMRWYNELLKGWKTLRNYFKYRVTSSLSEGINNVIKSLKRRAFGYKNMHYFKLKIMQVCGYLNSRFIPSPDLLLTKI